MREPTDAERRASIELTLVYQRKRIAELEDVLRKARPYVKRSAHSNEGGVVTPPMLLLHRIDTLVPPEPARKPAEGTTLERTVDAKSVPPVDKCFNAQQPSPDDKTA